MIKSANETKQSRNGSINSQNLYHSAVSQSGRENNNAFDAMNKNFNGQPKQARVDSVLSHGSRRHTVQAIEF